MPLVVNLRHLEAHNVVLAGELPLQELDFDSPDEMVRPVDTLAYHLEVQRIEEGLLVQGRLSLPLECKCVRCLRAFRRQLTLPHWTRHLPLQGEESIPISNDCVDLTPSVREDILLEFPQHPLCEPECGGLPGSIAGKAKNTNNTGQFAPGSTAWNELDKLKF